MTNDELKTGFLYEWASGYPAIVIPRAPASSVDDA